MGLELLCNGKVFSAEEAAKIVHSVVSSPEDIARRYETRVRVRLYFDRYQDILSDVIQKIFHQKSVVDRLLTFMRLVGGTSFLKRIADELGRPIYARAPQRTIRMGDADASATQDAWTKLVKESRLNQVMALVARLLTPLPNLFILTRYVASLKKLRLNLLTPDVVSVVEHPDDKTVALAIAYATSWSADGKATSWAVLDDTRAFAIDQEGKLLSMPVDHGCGLIPCVEIRRREPVGCYWDDGGADLESAALCSMFYDLMILRKLKTQSHIQLTFSGDPTGFTKNQVSDEESVLIAGMGGSLSPINMESDPSAMINARTLNETTVAANYGISRERLNQQQGEMGEDVALRERVAELAMVVMQAEEDAFRVIRAVSKQHDDPSLRIPDEAEQGVDLGQLHNRIDRKTQLDIRQQEREMGERSGVDDVLEDNPEFGADRELAKKYIEQRMQEEAVIVLMRRALNAPAGGTTPNEPGQSPEENGAMGPAVRDGQMTKDEAATAAESGDKPDRRARLLKIVQG